MESFSLRPLGIPEIIDAAIRLLRRHARTLFSISAVVLVPLGVIQYFFSRSLERVALGLQPISPTADPDQVLEQMLDSLGPLFLAGLASGALAGLAQLLVQLGSVKAISDIYLDRTPGWRDSLTYGFRRLPSAIGAFLIAVVPLVVGFLLCVLPGIALATFWSLTGVAVAAERLGPGAGLSRSYNLVKKRFWPMLGVLALAVLINIVIGLVSGAIVGAATLASATIQLELQTVLNLLISIVTTPFIVAVLTVAYFDLRVRQEGFDLELMAGRSESGQSADEPILPPADDTDPFGLGRPGRP